MTAEVGILNTSGVALAADSAVTIGGEGTQKVYNSANKLFSLSKVHPVGIMIYGGADFMGIPWETIIKTYRKNLGGKKFDSLYEYSVDFINFLKSDERFYSPQSEQNLVGSLFYTELMEILNDEVNDEINKMTSVGEAVNNSDVEKIVIRLMEKKVEKLNNYNTVIDDANFLPEFHFTYSTYIKEILDGVFKFELSREAVDLFVDYCGKLIKSELFRRNYSGLVISGYGEEEIFPSLFDFKIDGIYQGHLKYHENTPVRINSYSDEDYATASIRPFAQSEMVYSFLSGIEPTLEDMIMSITGKTITDYNEILAGKFTLDEEFNKVKNRYTATLVKNIRQELMRIQNELYIRPVLDIVEILPKEELADMAEALVNLTSFRRRVSMDAESVGGPVDVCVITKGDGLIWIKRKHYFNPSLNYNFFQNYSKGMDNND